MKQRNEPDLQDVLNGATEDLSYSLNCHRVGVIQSFNAEEQTATVKMIDKGVIQYDDGEQLVDYALLVDCPVVIYKGAKGGFTIPVNEGDPCLVCFNDRDLDSWLVDGLTQRPNTLRHHDFSDAIVVVGIRNQINKIVDYNNESTEMNYLDSKISIDDSKINLINTSGGSIVLDEKLELKNTAENLKAVIDDFITIITSLKTVDNPASPTITLVVDTPTTNALTALSIRVGALLK